MSVLMIDSGFIKIHRKITQWEWYQDGNTFRLFIHLLLKANHKPRNWRGIEVDRGQLITGRKTLADDLGLSEQQIRTSLSKLKSTSEITIKPTNKYSLVTLINYDFYQNNGNEQPAKQPTKEPTDNQQITTNKNEKNVKNNTDGSNPVCISSDWMPNEINNQWMNEAGLSDFEKKKIVRDFRDFWLNSKSKKKNWDLAFRKNPIVNRVVNTASAKKQQPVYEDYI